MNAACVLVAVLAGAACVTPGHCAIYVQRDPASGALVYTNVPGNGREGERGATRPDRAAPARMQPATAAPVRFPFVSRSDQQRRDLDRQAILNDELHQEQQRLRLAQASGAAVEILHRHRSNIEALVREIAASR